MVFEIEFLEERLMHELSAGLKIREPNPFSHPGKLPTWRYWSLTKGKAKKQLSGAIHRSSRLAYHAISQSLRRRLSRTRNHGYQNFHVRDDPNLILSIGNRKDVRSYLSDGMWDKDRFCRQS